jgi:hypothetical protein
LSDPTTVFAGPALLANIRDQSEHEALAARCHTKSGVLPSSSSTGRTSQSEIASDVPACAAIF